ncbi:MAG: ring-cleaving dioxygenase [Vicinamibacterales bacterium]
MRHPVLGLHHVTATVNDAQSDLDFCTDLLGLRLVKKTVNFDNHDVYHFYYGTEQGAPGTIWTTFPYKGRGVPVGIKGTGQVVTTAFSVPAGSLPFWRDRLAARDVHGAGAPVAARRFGDDVIAFDDPSGLRFELVATDQDDREPWTGAQVDAGDAIRGLHSVTLLVRNSEPTARLLTEVLGFTIIGEESGRIRLVAGGATPGHAIDIVAAPDAVPAMNGLGTVHHVAMAIATSDEQLRLRDDLLSLGLRVTEVRDRCYFQSIYFREPGGVLFEVATIQPGFSVDEDVASLGRALKLPPWEEPSRAAIEAALPPVSYR